MVFPTELGQRLRQIMAPLFIASLAGYFAYHAIQGERGVIAWLKLRQQVERTETALSASRAKEQRLAHRVSLLRPESLDRDLLDERARAVLNLAAENEQVIFIAPADQAAPSGE